MIIYPMFVIHTEIYWMIEVVRRSKHDLIESKFISFGVSVDEDVLNDIKER